MSEEIDWSKAPEGATHKCSDKNGFWYKFDFNLDTVAYCPTGRDIWFSSASASEYAQDGSMDNMISRPAHAWNGEGLPPVGATCERRFHEVEGSSWFGCIVLAHGSRKIFIRDDNGDEWAHSLDEVEFRPYPTVEQIAAEEKDAAISEMISACAYPGSNITRHVCEELYALGYRKCSE